MPKLQITGAKKPLVEVMDAKGELVHAIRVQTREWQPLVFSEGNYTIRVSDPESGKATVLKAVTATKENQETLPVDLA